MAAGGGPVGEVGVRAQDPRFSTKIGVKQTINII